MNNRPVSVAVPSQDDAVTHELMADMLQHLDAILALPDLESFPKTKKLLLKLFEHLSLALALNFLFGAFVSIAGDVMNGEPLKTYDIN